MFQGFTDQGKNLMGTFYHPSEVIIDANILKHLPIKEIKSGYSEIIKHALINDRIFFNWLEKNTDKLLKLDLSIIEKAVHRSIKIKLDYVKKDPKEKLINSNSRAMLNFGHTIGHALETYYKYSEKINHGEAISIGMIVESIISHNLGYLNKHELIKIIKHFKSMKLKTSDINIKNDKVLENIFKDKKNVNNQINIVLLRKVGKSFFCRDIEFKKIKNIITNI